MKKICLTFSAGGHFTEMKKLLENSDMDEKEIVYVTIKAKSTENLNNAYFIRDTFGPTILHHFFNIIMISIQSLAIILKCRPVLIVSTGADVTIPICCLGKLMGSKLIFIESICRSKDLSFSGKILYPISDIFIVQWPELVSKYPKSKFWGSII